MIGAQRGANQIDRVLLLIAFVGFVSLGLPDTVIGVAWPSVRAHFGLQQRELGLVFLGAGCGYFLSSAFAGRFMQWWGIGVLLGASTALVAASALGFAVSPAWYAFATCALFHGLGSGAIDAGLNNFVAHNFSAKYMNWLHACYSFGAATGPLMMTAALTSAATWRMGYIVLAVPLSALALVFAGTRSRWTVAKGEGVGAAPTTIAGTVRNSAVWLHLMIFFVYTGLEITVGQWSFTVLVESRKVQPQVAGIAVGVYWGAIGLGRVLFGLVVDRWGIDRLLRGCMLLAVAGSLMYAIPAPPLLAFLGLAMLGLALAPIYPCLMTKTPQRLGAIATHAIGLQVSAAMIGGAALPAGTGVIASQLGLECVGVISIVLAAVLSGLHEALLFRDRH